MATKALTDVARRASFDPLATPQEMDRDWREILATNDAEAVWQEISLLIRSSRPDRESDCDRITQEIFLYLLSTKRIPLYLDQQYSNEEIALDMLSLVP